jgi:polyphosphate:AMP phosphotransferase
LKTINTNQPLKKSEFKPLAQALRVNLLQWQFRTSQKDRPVIIVIAGDDRSGRHDTIHTLLEWLDPRFIRVNAYGPSEQQDNNKPFFWRFWRDMPAAGNIGLYMREWTSSSINQYLNEEISEAKLGRRVDYIKRFEKALSDDGALIIKLWLHLSEEAHALRVESVKDTPFFDEKDELAYKNYNHAVSTIERVLEQTNAPHAPWHVINSDDPMQRDIIVGQIIEKQLSHWVEASKPIVPSTPPPSLVNTNILNSIDLNQAISKDDYETKLDQYREELRQLMSQAHLEKRAVVCVFEGVDAAGKGGAIRRLVSALDVGHYRIVPVAKPTEEEYRHHYLWRFWRNMPANGLLTIFDRSWYGRVLVERVEKFAGDHEWQRAYQEINDFEDQMVQHGIIVVKFWLHIDQDEQLQRFKAREKTPHKQHKITEEDYRNRDKWHEYREAIHDMISQTDTKRAPWTLISAQDKKFARIAVFKTLIDRLNSTLSDR